MGLAPQAMIGLSARKDNAGYQMIPDLGITFKQHLRKRKPLPEAGPGFDRLHPSATASPSLA
jgi:hypothetical protein